MAIGNTNVDNMKQIINILYPIGSVYINANSDTLPAVLSAFGTWEKIEGKFLLSSSSSYSIKSTGGEASHTLTVDEMPSHKHGTNWGKAAYESLGWGLTQNGGFLDRVVVWLGLKDVFGEPSGGGAAHNNMPPYLSVAMWKRTA